MKARGNSIEGVGGEGREGIIGILENRSAFSRRLLRSGDSGSGRIESRRGD